MFPKKFWKMHIRHFVLTMTISTWNCLQFDTTTVILHKSNIHQEVKKRDDFEMSVPSCMMCCTIMVHFIRQYCMFNVTGPFLPYISSYFTLSLLCSPFAFDCVFFSIKDNIHDHSVVTLLIIIYGVS